MSFPGSSVSGYTPSEDGQKKNFRNYEASTTVSYRRYLDHSSNPTESASFRVCFAFGFICGLAAGDCSHSEEAR